MYLKIGGTTYKVVVVEDLCDPINNAKLNGRITWTDSKIRVCSKIKKQKRNQVLIHEAVHGILDDYYIEDENEGVVVKLANGMYAFIVDNADFIKDLIKHDQKLKKQTKD